METIDDDAEKTGIQFVKINDKRLGKSFGIKKFPALTMIRDREVFIYDGDLKVGVVNQTDSYHLQDEEIVLEFLTDDDNFSMGDKIEDVDADTLISIIESDPYVSVFFYDDTKESSKALEHMEDIDDDTDVFNIRSYSFLFHTYH